jgi:plasmid stabilization system protein ParE
LLKLAITQQARTDLADVQAFTIERFGLEQWPIYQRRISDSLRGMAPTSVKSSHRLKALRWLGYSRRKLDLPEKY